MNNARSKEQGIFSASLATLLPLSSPAKGCFRAFAFLKVKIVHSLSNWSLLSAFDYSLGFKGTDVFIILTSYNVSNFHST